MTGRGSKSGRAAVGPLPWFMWSLGALFFCYAFFQRVAPSVLVSDLMRDFGVGAAVLGNLSAFYFYAYAGMQLPLGVLVDNWGPRRILTGGALVCGLGTRHCHINWAGRKVRWILNWPDAPALL